MKELSGDIKLSRPQQIWYLTYNFCRGIWGYRSYIKTRLWSSAITDDSSDSPGRQYLNSFLNQEIPKLITKKKITVLDIGCGTGYILDILENLGYEGEYVGVDVFREPTFQENREKFSVEFIQKPIEEFESNKQFDLVISNTAFEHIPDDFTAAKQAQKYAGLSAVQIHIMPAFWSLPIYLLHGYRQYTPTRIKKLFPERSAVYRLGGILTFFLSLIFMTIPERFLSKYFFKGKKYPMRKTKIYPKLVKFANTYDKFLPLMSSFYIVVINQKNNQHLN